MKFLDLMNDLLVNADNILRMASYDDQGESYGASHAYVLGIDFKQPYPDKCGDFTSGVTGILAQIDVPDDLEGEALQAFMETPKYREYLAEGVNNYNKIIRALGDQQTVVIPIFPQTRYDLVHEEATDD